MSGPISPKTAYTVSAGFKCLELFYKKNIDLYLCYCGLEECSKGHSFGPTIREDYLIHYITEGCGTYTINGKTYNLKKGDYFLIPPEIETYYKADLHTPWNYGWIAFNGAKASMYLEYMNLDSRCKLTGHYENSEKIISLIEQMLNARNLTNANELKRESLLYAVLSEFAEEAQTSYENRQEYPQNIYIEHILHYIEDNYKNKIKISELAEEVGLTRTYLSTMFSEQIGTGIKDYIINLRLEKAEELLKHSDLSIQSVALQTGYEDALAFSKAFKKKFNLSPSEYRKQLKKNDSALQIINKF